MDRKVEVAIIGAGTAGINALAEIRKVTDDFVLINDGPLGTTCARVGCMPSKAMIQIGNDFHRRRVFGREGIGRAELLAIDVRRAMVHVRELRDAFVAGIIKDVIEPLGERFVEGQAEFIEPTVLKIAGSTIRAGRIVIATGSRPVVPRQWQKLGDRLNTTDSLFEQDNIPMNMAVIGLGAIGLEIGQALTRLGIHVIGCDRMETIGGLQDPEVNRAAVEILGDEMPMALGSEAGINETGEGLRITPNGGDPLTVDKALVSVGRAPNLDGLHLDRLGVDLDEAGVPFFNPSTMQVADLPVFIAGDAANHRPVLHEVAHEGTVAGYNAVHKAVLGFKRKASLVICFSDPNIGRVGASWQGVKRADPAVGTAVLDGGREKIMLKERGMIRIYAERKTGRLLGSEMVAPHGEHLAHLLAWSIQQNLTVFDLMAMPFYHPTVEETLKAALEDLASDVDNHPNSLSGFEFRREG
jgi:dihydrolipoamide dehydrogenase